ncbi:MAG: hypothetical protein OEV28_10395 [Nitrospirota bacterium]|nr:hypothetical protein [Nitrospirota bacterium]
MAKRILLLFLIATGLMLTACGSKEEKSVKEAVRAYNAALIEAFIKPNPDLMADVATAKQHDRVGLYIVNLMQKGQVLKGSLDSISFGKIRFEGAGKAMADTKEEWTYAYLGPDRQPTGPSKKVRYEVTYTLLLEQGDWMVDALDIHKEK